MNLNDMKLLFMHLINIVEKKHVKIRKKPNPCIRTLALELMHGLLMAVIGVLYY